MSSLSHPVESSDSSQSLASRRQSEMGSQYMVESGFYMSSFTATIFIAALVSVGLTLLTLLVALVMMLKSCQSTGSGVLEHGKESYLLDYCNLFVFHAELNNMKAGEIPVICKFHDLHYFKRRYLQDFNTSLRFVEEHFSRLMPDDDGLDVILLDADDVLSLIGNFSRISSLYGNKQFEDMKHQAHMLLVRLHTRLQATSWSLVLFSRKLTKNWNSIASNLISCGYSGWSSLILRSDGEMQMENWEYLSSRRLQMQRQGFRIAGLISSQMDTFRGPCLGRRNFKLTNLLYNEVGIIPNMPA
ncbi:hypothetical protein HPP92_014857 [Vanilla planifolia]|uniref:Uncharacterized protein n=1 Tax=Vanilla planifolia TaxID=51239 RepID=A0A835QQD5_VANPL|nr:hypothetical protein HPP92_014857 [Vanilla planifolia]